jgi:uncharacterized protein (TIGR04255 family)
MQDNTEGNMPEVYKKNFLTNVLCHLQFEPILRINEEEPVDLQERLRPRFPKYVNRTQSEISVRHINQEPEVKFNTLINNRFFCDKDNVKSIVVNKNSIKFDNQKYTHFAEYVKDLKETLGVFEDIYKPMYYSKIGFRPFNWKGLIHKDLVAATTGFVKNKKEIARCFSELVIRKENYRIVFRFGLYNPEYPNPVVKKDFVLDYECQLDDEIAKDEALNYIEIFNNDIYELFEESIGDDLRKLMKEGE